MLQVPTGRAFRAAVVADTHSRPHPNAKAIIASLEPSVIFHAGDIGRLGVLEELGALAPVIAVRGNIDERAPDLSDSIDVTLQREEHILLRLLLVHIAVYGPKVRPEVARLAAAHRASLVLCGHSHVPFAGSDRGLVVFNPGSIGPRRFHLPITLGVLEVGEAGIDLRHIDCESGEPWRPQPLRHNLA